MVNLALMRIDIGFEGLVDDKAPITIERRGNSNQNLSGLRLNSHRHSFASH
jgi:hypothetical protein